MKKRRLPYWYLLLPLILGYVGSTCNILAMLANHQKMPVYYGSYYSPDSACTPELVNDEDKLHTCLTKETRLKVLTDWIHLPHEGWISVGDLLIDIYEGIWFPCFVAWIALLLRDRHASQP